MADAYVDLEQTASTATSPYDTWAKAAADMQTAITQAGSGGRVFVRIDGDGVGTTKDTAASIRTLTFPGTDQVPFGLYGVKDATTAAPPTDSDLCVRGTDVLPVYEATGGANDITIDEASANTRTHITIHGIRFDSADDIIFGFTTSGFLSDCELNFDAVRVSNEGNYLLVNCDFEFLGTGSNLRVAPGYLTIVGGVLSGAVPTILVDATFAGTIEFHGIDLSAVTGTLMDFTSATALFVKIVHCKLATGVTRITGTVKTTEAFIEVIGSSDETGLGSGESVRDYAKEYFRGTILNEATIIRTGGANDGVAGFSYAIKPRADSTKEGMLSLATPLFGGLVEGDGSTSKDFTFYIANDSGSDLTKADAWPELFIPSASGVTQHDFDISERTVIDASAADIADDTASDWSTGAGGKNAQKIVITLTPDYTGPVYGRMHFAQKGTTTLYSDPKIDVTDT